MYIQCDKTYVQFMHNEPLSEICAVSKVSKKDIGRVFKLILKTLETSVELITTGDFMVRCFQERTPTKYCESLVDLLHMNIKILQFFPA